MSIPPLVAAIVDDAAIFPPGNAPLPAAVAAHRRHAGEWYAEMLGPFVVGDQRLPELVDLVRADDRGPVLSVTVVVAGGAGSLEPALTWVRREPALRLHSVEIAVREDAGAPGGLAHNAGRVVTALAAGSTPVRAHVELPRPDGEEPGTDWLRALDVLAGADVPVKLRTGGETPQAHPSEPELVACIDAVLDRELAFKATAGLHAAVRRTSPEGFEQHGFLNLLVATGALLDGAGRETATGLLAERDPATLVAAVRSWPTDRPPPARRWFTSFGSCSVTEPVDDLVALGLLHPATSDPEAS